MREEIAELLRRNSEEGRKTMAKNDRTMNHSDVPGSSVCFRSGRSKAESLRPSPPGGTRLQLPPGEADIEELRSVTREWLVPRLVEKFLRVHGIRLKHVHKLANRLQPALLGQAPAASAGPVSNEIKSPVKRKTNTRTLSKEVTGK
jgi:hypothetical protein